MSSQRVHGWANVRVRDEQTGRTVNVNSAEDTAFWQWACIETLRHTGARNEVLLELSQLSIRQYVRPNGEVIALLVIAPSKTDRERVVPMTAELFHVIACIIRRLTRGRPSIALATRYDKHEHVTSEPQPHQPTGNRVSAGDRRRMGRVRAALRQTQVELGQCGRPYATACEHEHACIRCPMLRVDPKMIDRPRRDLRRPPHPPRTRADQRLARRDRRHRPHPALPRRQTRRHPAPRPPHPGHRHTTRHPHDQSTQ